MDTPLKSVDGVTVKVPTTFIPTLSDVSAADAGNSEDGTMWKKRIGQKLQYNITWENISRSDAAAVLSVFNPEYVTCEILDPRTGEYSLISFYVGDRNIGTYNAVTDRWSSLSFNIIQRSLG